MATGRKRPSSVKTIATAERIPGFATFFIVQIEAGGEFKGRLSNARPNL
jgi:hypothetical protein